LAVVVDSVVAEAKVAVLARAEVVLAVAEAADSATATKGKFSFLI
jgi:hypothetical protein